MPHLKTSQAMYKHVRLNPIHPEHKRAIEIIEQLESQGFSFGQIVVDAVLRADGETPEMFPKSSALNINRSIEKMFEKLTQELLNHISSGKLHVEDAKTEGEEVVSPFASAFAKGFMQRLGFGADEFGVLVLIDHLVNGIALLVGVHNGLAVGRHPPGKCLKVNLDE